jgi:hypothetical protein
VTKTFLRTSVLFWKDLARSARHTIETLEREAPLLDGPGDRFSGYAVISLSFQSGHVLALRRFSASSIGPGYVSVWHRGPSGSWTFYSTVSPELSCARYFGGQIERNVVTPIEITWLGSMRFRIVVGAAIDWHVSLGTSLTTRLLNVAAGTIPERAWQSPAVLRFMGIAARATLGTGRLNLTGLTPNGQRFIANSRRLWLIESTDAVVEGVNVGPVGPLTNQASLGDFLLPQRGLIVVARARFEQRPARESTRAGRAGSCTFAGPSVGPPDFSRTSPELETTPSQEGRCDHGLSSTSSRRVSSWTSLASAQDFPTQKTTVSPHHEAAPDQKGNAGALVKIVRESTERFRRVSVAEAEGYALQFGCVTGSDAGAMGLHFVNGSLVNAGVLDGRRPRS